MKATRFLLGALLLLLCGTVLQAQPSLVPKPAQATWGKGCLLYTSDAADDSLPGSTQPRAQTRTGDLGKG